MDTVISIPEAKLASIADSIAWMVENIPGSTLSAEGHEPFFIENENHAWLVLSGHIDLFAVAVEDGAPTGQREHFLSTEENSLLVGMDFESIGTGHAFLAVGSPGTRVFRFNFPELVEPGVLEEDHSEALASLIDVWLTNLAGASVRSIVNRAKPDVMALANETLKIPQRGIASSKRRPLWVKAESAALAFLSTEEMFFETEWSLFPITPYSWVESFDAHSYETQTTDEVLHSGHLVAGIRNFHSAICSNEFINKQLLAVDEYNRLKTKAEYQQAAREEALAEIASVLSPEFADAVDVRVSGGADALLAAVKLIGKDLAIVVKPHPDTRSGLDMASRLELISKASRFRIREIALRDDWWNGDHGPFLAFGEDDEEPFAILPVNARKYRAVSGKTGQQTPVNAAFAETLKPFGQAIYRPMPEVELTPKNLFRFATHKLKPEFLTIVMMGIGLGLLGLVTPFFTRQIFDEIIPGAARSQLLQLVGGMLAASAGILAFEITRAIAVLRIEGKMDYSVQSGLWDRLLSLPLNFFRRFSAGDLANRAYGIDKIRELVSGVGVTSILGATTSLFYLFLLFKYSLPLTLAGLGLVAFAMLFTVGLNIWQLSYQRHLYGIIGKITSTVLQFISGVAKIRVAGAEDHAFKVWAQEFSKQRRLSFVVGRITNAVQVFTASYPVICSLVLFAMLAFVQGKANAEGLPPAISTGEFIAFNSAFGIFLSSMLSLSSASLQILQAVPVYERFKPILQEEPEIDEAKSYPGDLTGDIEVYRVDFRYTEDGPLILKNVSIRIKPGEFVAFVGPSGSGKSTLLRLLLGFEQPESGKIYYDGQDLGSLDIREVRQKIGVVLQTSRLMPTDIFRNIVGNSPLTKADAWDAAERAGLADDVRAMPMEMHTVVSEGGGGFSGGQKQRLMIARAIVNKPRILFLDEATSALDNRTQAIVTQSLDQLQATRIVVAHRLSTIINADRIFVLVNGRVEEQGTHEELMKLGGHFAELAKRQIA